MGSTGICVGRAVAALGAIAGLGAICMRGGVSRSGCPSLKDYEQSVGGLGLVEAPVVYCSSGRSLWHGTSEASWSFTPNLPVPLLAAGSSMAALDAVP